MAYEVRVVRDGELPGEHEWMFVKTTDGLVLLIESAAVRNQRVLAEVWAARRCMRADGSRAARHLRVAQ